MVKINYAHNVYLQDQSIVPSVMTKESEWTYAPNKLCSTA